MSQLYQQLCWSHSVTKWAMNERMNEQVSLPLETAVNANGVGTWRCPFEFLFPNWWCDFAAAEASGRACNPRSKYAKFVLFWDINRGLRACWAAGTFSPSRMGAAGSHELFIPERPWPSSSLLCSLGISPSAVNKICQKILGEDVAFSRRLLVTMAFCKQNSLLWSCLQDQSVWATGWGGMVPFVQAGASLLGEKGLFEVIA